MSPPLVFGRHVRPHLPKVTQRADEPVEVLGVELEVYRVSLEGQTVALIGAHSSVGRDVEADTVVAGAPAKRVCKTDEILLKDGSGLPAYPWRRHFGRGYPSEIVAKWLEEFGIAQPGQAAHGVTK